MNIRLVIMLAGSYLLTACCGTTVVLVPDADGKVGEVSVTTETGTTVLNQANQSAKAKRMDEEPGEAVALTDQKVKEMFAETLAKEPDPPKHHKLYFDTGSATITPQSEAEFAKIVATIKSRQSCDISVIGHCDTQGTTESNRSLSLRRAANVKQALIDHHVEDKCMDDIRYYGEYDLAVPTADEVAEPLNRRVEVEIR